MAAEKIIVVKPTKLQFTAPNTVQDQIFGAVLVYRYTGEFLLFHIHTWSCDAFVNVSFLCVPVHEDTTKFSSSSMISY